MSKIEKIEYALWILSCANRLNVEMRKDKWLTSREWNILGEIIKNANDVLKNNTK
jgi:hypothetical protein